MDITYERMEWEDFPSTETPINAENLNHLEEGIAGLYSDRYDMQSNIAYVEDDETASKDYIPNSYLMRGGLFYKVTKTILYGDSFDSGEDGNIEHVDISSQFGSGGGGSTGCVEITQAQYDALSDEAKMLDVIYLITDSPDNYLDEVFGDFATVEYTDTASKAYAVGDYLVYDSKFYRVTSAIAQGDTIVPGTNVVKTTVADEFSNASNVAYDNAESGLEATDVQGAVDEVANAINSSVPIIEKRQLSNGGYLTRWADGRTEYENVYMASGATPSVWVGGIYYYDLNITIPSGVFKEAPTIAFATPRTNQWWVAGFYIGSATSGQIRLCRPSANSEGIIVSAIFRGKSPT